MFKLDMKVIVLGMKKGERLGGGGGRGGGGNRVDFVFGE